MGGFLSAYSGTRRIDVGGGYWIEVKDCLSIAEKQRTERAMYGTPTVDLGGRASADLDLTGFHTEMLVQSIVAWNLDDEDGTVWPLTPDKVKRASIARLPGPVFDRVFKVVNDLNGPQKPQESAQFRDAGGCGDPDGDAGTGIPVDVLDGAAAVAAPGAAPGGPGVPSLA